MAEDDPLRAGLAALVPASRGQDPSAARTRIRDTFDDITTARNRGVTWAQIAELMKAEGTRAADGEPLTPDEVKALYHAEKYARGSQRKRRKAQPKVARVAPPSPTRPEAPEPPPAMPTRPESGPPVPVNPYAEVDRRTAEAEARRQRIEAAKEWNPYATPQGKDAPDE